MSGEMILLSFQYLESIYRTHYKFHRVNGSAVVPKGLTLSLFYCSRKHITLLCAPECGHQKCHGPGTDKATL